MRGSRIREWQVVIGFLGILGALGGLDLMAIYTVCKYWLKHRKTTVIL